VTSRVASSKILPIGPRVGSSRDRVSDGSRHSASQARARRRPR
jgi:hypothetical protein